MLERVNHDRDKVVERQARIIQLQIPRAPTWVPNDSVNLEPKCGELPAL